MNGIARLLGAGSVLAVFMGLLPGTAFGGGNETPGEGRKPHTFASYTPPLAIRGP